jgi:hypothetical protein
MSLAFKHPASTPYGPISSGLCGRHSFHKTKNVLTSSVVNRAPSGKHMEIIILRENENQCYFFHPSEKTRYPTTCMSLSGK